MKLKSDLAEVDIAMDLSLDVVDEVVDHRQSDEDGHDRDDGERDSRRQDDAVRADAHVDFVHHLFRINADLAQSLKLSHLVNIFHHLEKD